MMAAVVEPLKACVESGADFDYGAFRMAAEKVLDQLIEHGAPQRTANDAPPLVEPLEIQSMDSTIPRDLESSRMGSFLRLSTARA